MLKKRDLVAAVVFGMTAVIARAQSFSQEGGGAVSLTEIVQRTYA